MDSKDEPSEAKALPGDGAKDAKSDANAADEELPDLTSLGFGSTPRRRGDVEKGSRNARVTDRASGSRRVARRDLGPTSKHWSRRDGGPPGARARRRVRGAGALQNLRQGAAAARRPGPVPAAAPKSSVISLHGLSASSAAPRPWSEEDLHTEYPRRNRGAAATFVRGRPPYGISTS